MKRRSPRDDLQILNLREQRDEFLRQSVGKIALILFLAHVQKRQHRDRFRVDRPRDENRFGIVNRLIKAAIDFVADHDQHQERGARADRDDQSIAAQKFAEAIAEARRLRGDRLAIKKSLHVIRHAVAASAAPA